MPVSSTLLELINAEVQSIPVEDPRWRELATELNQLRAAAEAAFAVHDFDRDPAAFERLLMASRVTGPKS